MKPVTTEDHEIVIALNDEIAYLLKRLKPLAALDLFSTDNDYLNAIYKNLPHHNQLMNLIPIGTAMNGKLSKISLMTSTSQL